MSMSKMWVYKWQSKDTVLDNLLYKPFPQNYVIWDLHGEKKASESSQMEDVLQEHVHPQDPMEMMINDAFEHCKQQDTNVGVSQPLGSDEILNEGLRDDHSVFHDLFNGKSQTF